MDLLKFPANLNYIRYHYGDGARCGILTDGSVIKPLENSTTSGPLASLPPFEVTSLLIPGFIGYHETQIRYDDWVKSNSFTDSLPWETHLEDLDPQVAEDNPDKTLIVWCGELYTAYKHMSQTSGTQVTFRTFPTGGGYEIMMMMHRLEQVFMLLFLSSFSMIPVPIIKPASYMWDIDYGSVILHKKYERTEFMFVQSFDANCWLATGASLVAVATAMTLVSKYRQQGLVNVGFATQLFKMVVKCLGLLLGNSQDRLDHIKSGLLIGIWLIAVTVLCRCMTGKMRELMRFALRQVVPENWYDLVNSPAFASQQITLCNLLPSYGAFKLDFPELFEPHLSDRIDMMTIDVMDLDTVMQTAERFGQVLTDGYNFILITMNLLFISFLWTITIFRPYIETYIETTDAPHRLHMTGSQILDTFLDTIFQQAYVSPPHGTHQIYLIGLFKANPLYTEYVDQLMHRMRGAGFMSVMFERNEANLVDRFFHYDNHESDASSKNGSMDGYVQIILEDLKDPFILFAALLGFTCITSFIEHHVTIFNKVKKMRKNRVRVHPLQSFGSSAQFIEEHQT